MEHPQRWWSRPELEDPDRDARAATLWRVALVFAAFSLPSVVAVALRPEWRASLPISFGALATWTFVLYLIRRNALDAAAWFLVLGLWALASIGSSFTGGLESPVITALGLSIVGAGLLLNVRSTVVITFLSTLTVLALLASHQLGIEIPNLSPQAPSTIAPIAISCFAAACVMIASARIQIQRSQELSRRYEEQLEERNRQLERAEARYQEINELTSEFFYSMRRSRDGTIETELISDAFERVTGYSVDEMTEQLWRDNIHPDDIESIRARDQASPAERPTVSDYRFFSKSGEVRWLRDHSRLVAEADGSVRVYGSSHDITDAKLAEAEGERLAAELRQSQKMEAVGRLAGGIAHDFNNLLTAISGFGELLLDETRPGDEAHFAAEQIVAAADSAAELTQQLMAFSRRPTHRHGSVDVDDVLRTIEPMLTRLLGETFDIRLDLAGDAIRVAGQQSLMEQVIVNLAVNARDAMPLGGVLEISTEGVPAGQPPYLNPDVDHLHICVADSGFGMEPSVAARAFEPFFTTKETGDGTGLGLATVYGIVQQCGGIIQVESEPNQGSRFDIYLPQADPEDLYIGEVFEGAKHARLTPKRVLVVEDDDRVRNLIYRCLSRDGHTVFEARHGGEALALAEEQAGHIDLLVSDVVMPGIDGIELSDQLRRRYPDMRVLLVSGYASRPGAGRRDLPSEVAFLQKPFGPRGLERKLDEVFSEMRPATAH